MVRVCQWIAGTTVQKRLPQKTRVVECVYWDQIVKGAIDDMVSRKLGRCENREAVWRRQNNVVLSDMSTEGTVRGVDDKTASRDDSPKTESRVQDHVVP